MAEKIDLLKDKNFCALLIDERASLLARVDAIEKFLEMDRTKELRSEVKRMKYESSKTGRVKDA